MNPNVDVRMLRLRHLIRNFYDLQKLRIQNGNRTKSMTIELSEEDKSFFEQQETMLNNVEKHALKEVDRVLSGDPIYEWLREQRGIGPTMAAMLIGYINIEMCHTVSKLWKWCGLSVENGEADRRRKGEKSKFDPWLKSKVLAVLGGSFLKAAGRDEHGYYNATYVDNPNYLKGTEEPDDAESFFVRLFEISDDPTDDQLAKAPAWDKKVAVRRPPLGRVWRKFYDDRKHRQESMRIDCMGCAKTGVYKPSKKERERLEALRTFKNLKPEEVSELKELEAQAVGKKCGNCNGTGGPAPWGRSAAHRHNDALRYMVKQFLAEFWEKWRVIKGLPVRPLYAVEYLDRKHHTYDAAQA